MVVAAFIILGPDGSLNRLEQRGMLNQTPIQPDSSEEAQVRKVDQPRPQGNLHTRDPGLAAGPHVADPANEPLSKGAVGTPGVTQEETTASRTAEGEVIPTASLLAVPDSTLGGSPDSGVGLSGVRPNDSTAGQAAVMESLQSRPSREPVKDSLSSVSARRDSIPVRTVLPDSVGTGGPPG